MIESKNNQDNLPDPDSKQLSVKTKTDSSPKTESTVNPTLAERKERAGLGNMSDDLFEKFERIHQLQTDLNTGEADKMYRIGGHVAEVLANANTYGSRAIATLSNAIGIKSTQLRECAHVAEAWTPKRFATIMKRRNSQGLPISFSHLSRIRTEADPQEREKWLDRTLKDSLSVRDLRAEMAKDADTNADTDVDTDVDTNTDADVETGDVLPSFLMVRRALSEMRDTIWQIQGGVATWQLRIFSPLGEDPAQFGDLAIDSLVQTREVCVDSQQALHDLIEQLDVAILEAREAAAAAAEGGDEDGE